MDTNTKNKQPVKPALHLVTKDQLNKRNEYVGTIDLSDFDGAIEFAANLDRVVFAGAVRAARYIRAKAGTGIEAGCGIKAGWGIKAGTGIKAGCGIKAGAGIEAGWGIKAGEGIEAGADIKAGEGIKVRLRVFAGLISWRMPEAAELEVRCKSFVGTLAYGKLALTEPSKPKAAKKSAKKGGVK